MIASCPWGTVTATAEKEAVCKKGSVALASTVELPSGSYSFFTLPIRDEEPAAMITKKSGIEEDALLVVFVI